MAESGDCGVPLDDPPAEGLRLATDAAADGLTLRLIGGVAVWVRCPSVREGPLSRTYGDVDVVVAGRDARRVETFLVAHGYEPDKLFNALHGAQRMNFMDPGRGRPLDVLVDRFAMCHAIDLRRRLDLEPLTIPLADLLLTKLQVVRLNDKDLRDAAAILLDHGPDAEDPLDLARVTAVLSSDWGFEHTVRGNLDRLRHAEEQLGDLAPVVADRASALVEVLDAAPKTWGWRVRARVGERVTWYEEPEDVRH